MDISRIKFLTALLLPLIVSLGASAESPICQDLLAMPRPAHRKASVRALSYNIAGLPSFLTRKLNLAPDRYQKIAANLRRRSPDFVAFQEIFTAQAKQILSDSGYPYVEIGPSRGIRVVDSGLAIISKHPMRFISEIKFGFPCAGLDCFAAKGAMAVEIFPKDGSEPYIVVNTHLDSIQAREDVREAQVKKVAAWLTGLKLENRNVLFMGDFNFMPRLGSYQSFLAALEQRNLKFTDVGGQALQDSSVRISLDANTNPRELYEGAVDHHFLFSGSDSTLITPLEVSRNMTENTGNGRMSDHKGYEVIYQFGPRAQ